MREVKVGQVWKWFEGVDAEFEVLAVGTDSADILYLGDGGFRATRPLHYWDDVSILLSDVEEAPEPDAVNHPSHYNSDPSGVECIEITRHRNFNIGAAFKYLWRAGLKEDASLDNLEKEIEDLEKAIFHIKDEIKRKRGE